MVWIPVILTLVMGPGMGQLYNKDYKKAAYLILISVFLFIGMSVSLKNMIMPYLPTDITTEDPTELSRMIQENMHKATADHGGVLYVYGLILFVVWGYSVVDAYKGGKRRQLESQLKAAALLKTNSKN